MRCLLKLTVAFAVAVLANVLIQPGGVGDECLFAARVYVSQNVCGMPANAPELLNAASRLNARQGRLPESLQGPDGSPLVPEVAVFHPDSGDDCSENCGLDRAAFACAK